MTHDHDAAFDTLFSALKTMTALCSRNPAHVSTDSDYCSICGAPMTPADAVPAQSPAPDVPAVPLPPPPGDAAPAGQQCPVCGTERARDARFCEVCRYNFETGSAGLVLDPSVVEAPPAPPEAAGKDAFLRDDIATSVADALAAPTLQPEQDCASAGETPPHQDEDAGKSNNGTAPLPSVTPATLPKWEITVVVDASLYSELDPALPLPIDQPEFVFPLDMDENSIGRRSAKRDVKPEVPITDPGVSHRHAKLYRTSEGGFDLLDVGSTNGTRLNGVELTPGIRTPVHDGDEITLGCWTRLKLRHLPA